MLIYFFQVFETYTRTLKRLCGTVSNVSVISSSNKIFIKFKSDKDTNGKGFNFEWKSGIVFIVSFIYRI